MIFKFVLIALVAVFWGSVDANAQQAASGDFCIGKFNHGAFAGGRFHFLCGNLSMDESVEHRRMVFFESQEEAKKELISLLQNQLFELKADFNAWSHGDRTFVILAKVNSPYTNYCLTNEYEDEGLKSVLLGCSDPTTVTIDISAQKQLAHDMLSMNGFVPVFSTRGSGMYDRLVLHAR